ncbi:keratin-associated protein 5-2-like protein [Columba livia]|nr:keratin-associated protein 5-2-like protein [Columba livia]
MIYSSGRESYFNLNSTWYDPSGSWLDTRRTPFRYGYNTCSSGCDNEGVEGMRGHDYRHYGYRQPVCSERCHGYAAASSCHGGGGSSCVRRPTHSCGSSGGCNSYGRSVCAERCHEPSGSCQGGGSSCVRRPTQSYGSSGGCQSYGRSVCAETCHGSGYQGGKPGKPRQQVAQCCPVQTCPPPVQVCPPPVQQRCVPMTKCIPRQQQKQVCKVPAQKTK